MWAYLFVGLVVAAQCTGAKEARKNGDPLHVGEEVYIRILVEEDNYFGVVACGEYQCGGVRVDGVSTMGMSYRTFVSIATNRPFEAQWWLMEDARFGNTFALGQEYVFVVSRPAENIMKFWMEGREDLNASVKLESNVAKLHVAFMNGVYRFIGNPAEPQGPTSAMVRARCGIMDDIPPMEEDGARADILEIKSGCKVEGNDKSEPMCIVYLVTDGVDGRQEVYRSQMARDKYDPEQEETLHLPFKFEEDSYLVLDVYDAYSECDTPDDVESLGMLKTPLATVNTKGNVEVAVTGPNGEKYSARFRRNCDQRINLQFSGRGLGGNGDVFLEILKTPAKKGLPDEEVFRSNKVTRDTDLTIWDELSLSVNSLCDGDYDHILRVYVMESSWSGNQLVGYFNTTVNELKQPQKMYLLMNHAKQVQLGGSYNHSGQLWVGEIPQNATFSQYVAVGFELVGTAQIDFTGSNNNVVPSLHHIGDEPNKYEVAIKAVGQIVEKFVANRTFRAYGFGAEFDGNVVYDFNLDLKSSSPECVGFEGVLKTYHKTAKELAKVMSGPTYFAPGLLKVIEMARKYQDGSKYFVHLLLTDGIIDDPEATEEAILEASKLPISIIIIGIGDADFSTMKTVTKYSEEEAEAAAIWTDGNRETRDIVQFVALRDFVSAAGGGGANSEQVFLRRNVLSKIPQQYLEYMKIKQIPPKPPKGSNIEHYCA